MDFFSSISSFHQIIIYLRVCNRQKNWIETFHRRNESFDRKSMSIIIQWKKERSTRKSRAHTLTSWKNFESSWRHAYVWTDLKCRFGIIILTHLFSQQARKNGNNLQFHKKKWFRDNTNSMHQQLEWQKKVFASTLVVFWFMLSRCYRVRIRCSIVCCGCECGFICFIPCALIS